MKKIRVGMCWAVLCAFGLFLGHGAGVLLAQCSGPCTPGCNLNDGDPYGAESTFKCLGSQNNCTCVNNIPAAAFCRQDYCKVCKLTGNGATLSTCYGSNDNCSAKDPAYYKCQGLPGC